jgi:hypothetical protein
MNTKYCFKENKPFFKAIPTNSLLVKNLLCIFSLFAGQNACDSPARLSCGQAYYGMISCGMFPDGMIPKCHCRGGACPRPRKAIREAVNSGQ